MSLPIVVGAGLLGLIFGSFVTALSYRLPRGISIAKGRSHCPSCDHVLETPDLIPVMSWMAHAGKCRHCAAPISARYPAIELLSATAFTAAALAVHDPVRLATVLALTPLLLAMAVIDLEGRRLPNVLVALTVPLLLVWRWHHGGDFGTALFVAAAAFTTAVALNMAGRRLMQAPAAPLLGWGDAKLLAVAALGLPVPLYFAFLTLAGVLGLAFGLFWRRRTGESRFPFGPAIAAALWAALLVPLVVPLPFPA